MFRVTAIRGGEAELLGEELRLAADAPLEDLEKVEEGERRKRKKAARQKEEDCYRLFRQEARKIRAQSEYEATSGYQSESDFFELPGRVLHIDGDANYLERCERVYERAGIPVYGVHTAEEKMADEMPSLLEMVRPSIVVITGHDAYWPAKGETNDLKAYRNSKNFGRAVRAARNVVPQMDELIIFAGACQSYFEHLLKAGANFASAPERINIHALDPVYIAARISFTPFMERVKLHELLRNTPSGEGGLGGIDTKGVLRRGLPAAKAVGPNYRLHLK